LIPGFLFSVQLNIFSFLLNQTCMKRFSFFICLVILAVSCSKNKNNPGPTNPVVVVPSDPDTLSAGWTKVGNIPIEETVNDIYFVDANNGYIATTGAIYKSTNGGSTWTKISTENSSYINIAARGVKACFVDGGSTIFNTQDYGVTIHSSSFANWPLPPGFQDCYYSSDNVCYAASHKYIFKSTNGGTSFDTVYHFQDDFTGTASLCFIDDMTGWVTRNYQVYKTIDGGSTWTSLKNLSNYAVPIYFLDATYGFLGDNNYLYTSSSGGNSWSQRTGINTTDPISDLHFFFPSKGVCCAGTCIYETSDGGNSWMKVVALGKKKIIEVFYLNDHLGWACGEYGYILKFNL